LPTEADADPPRLEALIARRALDASLRRHAPRRANPIAPTDANLLAGMKLYRNNCSGCHGAPGQRSNWGSEHFHPRVRQFAEEPRARPDWEVFWIVERGIRYSGMGGWSDLLPEDDRWRIAAFLSRLDSLPRAIAAEWKTPR
jgi:mono/diheme cytochrome c family protein